MTKNRHDCYGFHAVKSLLENPKRNIHLLYLNQERRDQRLQTLLELAQARSIPVEFLSLSQFNQRYPEQNHQGVVACVETLETYQEADLPDLLAKANKPCLILILDSVSDPHNLGACLRSSDATAVDFVLIPKDKSATLTPLVSKIASGAAESVPLVTVTNLARSLRVLQEAGVWIYGAAGEAQQSLYDLDFRGSVALVLGAEGSGLRRLTREHCDGLFSLPMLGLVSSLNVSVAAGICLYEVVRQRRT